MSVPTTPVTIFRDTGRHSFGDFIDMAGETKGRLPEGTLFKDLCETAWHLPDTVQAPTPCAIGNGWIRIMHFGIRAMSLPDKRKKGDIGECRVRGESWPGLSSLRGRVPTFSALPLREAGSGIMMTGGEVYSGRAEDRLEDAISTKVAALDSSVHQAIIVPDDRRRIRVGAKALSGDKHDIITKAGLSIDSGEVTRHGPPVAEAGNPLYGATLPSGAMTGSAESAKPVCPACRHTPCSSGTLARACRRPGRSPAWTPHSMIRPEWGRRHGHASRQLHIPSQCPSKNRTNRQR